MGSGVTCKKLKGEGANDCRSNITNIMVFSENNLSILQISFHRKKSGIASVLPPGYNSACNYIFILFQIISSGLCEGMRLVLDVV